MKYIRTQEVFSGRKILNKFLTMETEYQDPLFPLLSDSGWFLFL